MFITNNYQPLDIIFITAIIITISNILVKLDPQLNNFINKLTFEKRIYNIKLNILTFILIYLLVIFLSFCDTTGLYLNHEKNIFVF